MKVRIITVGKLKEKYLKQGIAEYQKRLQRYTKWEMIEVADEPTPDEASEKEEMLIKEIEGERLLRHVRPDDFVFVLALNGELMTSEAFAKTIEQATIHGKSTIDFIIGGSLGTSPAVNQRADQLVSFGHMTFPHQLMRLIMSEQIYRAFRIINHEPYHK
ncbi:MAG: 23S rRNA (pseudouridine(1915)-N(3))-methyltransferase RlmH [Aerococcus sp.]|nr:23S rRNA (pseudouridine(1915)-N(3))-methyltransferase RlmH [Aerococcus sp.]